MSAATRASADPKNLGYFFGINIAITVAGIENGHANRIRTSITTYLIMRLAYLI